jgi:hypothetical protein
MKLISWLDEIVYSIIKFMDAEWFTFKKQNGLSHFCKEKFNATDISGIYICKFLPLQRCITNITNFYDNYSHAFVKDISFYSSAILVFDLHFALKEFISLLLVLLLSGDIGDIGTIYLFSYQHNNLLYWSIISIRNGVIYYAIWDHYDSNYNNIKI